MGCDIRAHGVGIKIKEHLISTPFAMPQLCVCVFFNEMTGYPTATQPLSLEHGLRTGHKIRTRYKTRTVDCGLGTV